MLVIVYDVTSQYTFDAVSSWHEVAMAAEWAPAASLPSAALLFANKTDLTLRRQVSRQEGLALSDKLDMVYFEGSAVSNSINAPPPPTNKTKTKLSEFNRWFIESLEFLSLLINYQILLKHFFVCAKYRFDSLILQSYTEI